MGSASARKWERRARARLEHSGPDHAVLATWRGRELIDARVLPQAATCAALAPPGWVCEEHGPAGAPGCLGPWMPIKSIALEISHG